MKCEDNCGSVVTHKDPRVKRCDTCRADRKKKKKAESDKSLVRSECRCPLIRWKNTFLLRA